MGLIQTFRHKIQLKLGKVWFYFFQRYLGGGAWTFVGFHQPLTPLFYCIFDRQFWPVGFHQAENFPKIFQIFEKFSVMKPHTAKNGQILQNFAFFGQKRPFFGSKTQIFSKFRRLRRRNCIFFGRLRRPKCGIRPPPLRPGPPPKISLIFL